jgi:predicted CoA-substrate-specific enzyme activase
MRIIGIDLGKISFKAVWLENGKIKENFWKEHQQEIQKIWQELKEKWQIGKEDKVVLTGRLREILPFPSIVERVALEKALKFLNPKQELTFIRLGGGGFSAFKTNGERIVKFLQNPRCAAGTGSFLDQILARVGLDLVQADKLVEVEKVKALEITSRCGVTMKTDFTHLLNQGHSLAEVIASLLDSSAKNAASLALKLQASSKVFLIGGLSISQRILQTIKENLAGIQVEIYPQAMYFEALGAALVGSEKKAIPQRKIIPSTLVFHPGLKNYLTQVTKIDSSFNHKEVSENLILGLDIGSTGSKLVILTDSPIFEAYCETKGQPVQAAKNLIQQIPSKYLNMIKTVGCTGSGREIVASLLRASLSEEYQQQIFVLNEIAAHAQGAVYYDSEVDTVVDIGGQDAKFTRLEMGRVVDSCMNTVCSAGTGSFIAEQLQFLGIGDVKEFGRMALESPRLVDLGQHCAVFIAEQIDEAKRKGAKLEEIIAGLYYSIVLNYNNRVKGLRDYGQKIFLQGKPAENLALSCALAKVSGQPIIVPPSPGSVGALGIALLAKKEMAEKIGELSSLNLEKFLESQVLEKREFRCRSKDGCLEGNLCPIQVIKVKTGSQENQFFWGGACDKYEKIGKSQVLTPQPFLEREKLIEKLIAGKEEKLAKKTIGIPRGLETEEVLPLVITFFRELGFKIKLLEKSGLKSLEQGTKLCQTSFCAPLQVWAGEAKRLEDKDFIFLPKIIEIPGKKEEKRCYVCPLSQAAPDMFTPKLSAKILQPFLNFKEGYQKNKKEFLKLGLQLGCSLWRTWAAFKKAVKAQNEFEQELTQIGKRALEFGRKNQMPVITILGHPYVVNSPILSAGISETIQEKGAIALPVECYPLEGTAPNLENIYWGYGHRLLQAAYEIRRKTGVYPLWLSVYSCGPDSFLLHFFQYLSQDKPYTILESDAYTGQAGFKTRIEAFLYSIPNYQPKEETRLPDLSHFEAKGEVLKAGEKHKVLFPWMGEGSRIVSALLKVKLGTEVEYLPMADQETLEMGRKHTSGKECLPMIVTLSALLNYLKNRPEQQFSYFMPRAGGPCRFGQYQLLTKIILEKLGLSERVKVISPTSETGYRLSDQFDSPMIAKSWAFITFVDFLKDALLETRPGEENSGESERVFEKYLRKAENMVLKTSNDWSGFKKLWGAKQLAEEATEEFKKIPQTATGRKIPRILVTGEIYVRLDEFSNNQVIRELEALGAKVKLAPFREWINYTTYQRRKRLTIQKQKLRKVYLTWFLQRQIEAQLYQIFAQALGWQKDHHIEEILKTAEPYLSKLKPLGESALTIGLPLLLWRKKEIDGVVLVGPFECMPTRIGETQLALISEQTDLPVLNLSFSGEPLDKEILESFVWDLKKDF